MQEQKQEWPECLSKTVAEATTIISNDGVANIIPTPADSMVTMDYRLDRVRIFHDEHNKVTAIPRRG